ncbi:UNVERIFIED_CONTAM: hypothetical protein Sradi_2516100 [Sesamum radiatum]|uniref:RNase H type-1 domain-containing protein n=1 Tax=Sesamum radiatum TaxID=300843 RepID=A0AAW2SKH3_SESRA
MVWLLHADGSFTLIGGEARVVLTSPVGDEMEYALCFDFKASNNDTEYETLIAGIRIALDAGAKSLIAQSDSQLVTNQLEDWRKPLLDYLKEGILPGDEMEANQLKSRVARFALLQNILYKHSFYQPYLRCLPTEKGRDILHEIHEGVCGSHINGMALANKTLRAGYFWLTLKKDEIN